jgi:hypothetical protein
MEAFGRNMRGTDTPAERQEKIRAYCHIQWADLFNATK